MHSNLEATQQQQLKMDSTLNDVTSNQTAIPVSPEQVTLEHSAAAEQAVQGAAYSPGPGYQFIGADRPHQEAVVGGLEAQSLLP